MQLILILDTVNKPSGHQIVFYIIRNIYNQIDLMTINSKEDCDKTSALCCSNKNANFSVSIKTNSIIYPLQLYM